MQRPVFVIVALLPGAHSWAPLTEIGRETEGLRAAWRWPAPADAYTTTNGLAGGISYRIVDSFCETLLPRFNDDLFQGARIFMTCDALERAVAAAFAAWASNHRSVSFVDARADACDERGEPAGCMPVQVVISAEHGFESPNLAAFVEHSVLLGAATRKTNGRGTMGGGELVGARLVVNADKCFYADNTFCFRFHALKEQIGAEAARGVGQAILALLWTVAMVAFLVESCIVFHSIWLIVWERPDEPPPMLAKRSMTAAILRGMLERRRSSRAYLRSRLPSGSTRRERLSELAYNVADRHSPCVQLLLWLLLLFPPIFYWQVFIPCWECFDFAAMMTHEVGHVLGLDHPDAHAEAGTNLVAAERMGPAVCEREEGAPTRTDAPPAESVMLRFTQNSPYGCLAPDDLDGLNFLYPSCVGALPTVQCAAGQSNVGWLRLAFSVVVPTLVALSVTLALTLYVKRRNGDRMRELRRHLKDALDELEAAKLEADPTRRRAERALSPPLGAVTRAARALVRSGGGGGELASSSGGALGACRGELFCALDLTHARRPPALPRSPRNACSGAPAAATL